MPENSEFMSYPRGSLDFSQYNTSIKNSKDREVLMHWANELLKCPLDLPETREALNWLKLICDAAAQDGEVILGGQHDKTLRDLTEVAQLIQEGKIAEARKILFDDPENILGRD